jgi:hypothetical protein
MSSYNRGPHEVLNNKYFPHSKLSFEQLGKINLYLNEERLKYLEEESKYRFFLPAFEKRTEEHDYKEFQEHKISMVRHALEEAIDAIHKKMEDLAGADAMQEFHEKHDDSDPHIGCYSYPMCDEAPIGCVHVMGDKVEPIGHR